MYVIPFVFALVTFSHASPLPINSSLLLSCISVPLWPAWGRTHHSSGVPPAPAEFRR